MTSDGLKLGPGMLNHSDSLIDLDQDLLRFVNIFGQDQATLKVLASLKWIKIQYGLCLYNFEHTWLVKDFMWPVWSFRAELRLK